jgi:hypothetical protein
MTGRSFRFWVSLATLGALLATAGYADTRGAAPADEYFGPFKESILGIRNHINDIERKADSELAGAIRGLDNVEIAIEDWHRHYPHDSWLPGFLDRVVHVYGRAHLLTSPHAQSAYALLERDFRNSAQARDAARFVTLRRVVMRQRR